MPTKSHFFSIVLVLKTKFFMILAKDNKEDFIQRWTIVIGVGILQWRREIGLNSEYKKKMGNYSQRKRCGHWMKNY